MNWRRAALPLLVVAPLIILLASRFGTNPNALPSVLEGRPMPAFSLKTVNGDTVTAESLRGKPAVINFWSTWCVPCKVEHDILQEGSRRYEPYVQFLGVVYQDNLENVQSYLSKKMNRYPQLLDPDSTTAIDFGVSGVPESFIVDGHGIIRHKQTGVVTPEILVTHLNTVLKEGGAGR